MLLMRQVLFAVGGPEVEQFPRVGVVLEGSKGRRGGGGDHCQGGGG